MKFVRLIRMRDQKEVSGKCQVADSFSTRLCGLIGRAHLDASESMWFPECNNIHMWMMRMPIDVVFAKKSKDEQKFLITSIYEKIKPWRMFPVIDWNASDVFELPAGKVQEIEMSVGDELCIS